MSWTLQPVGGSEKSLADWGITGVSRTLRSLETSEVSFTIPAAFDAALPFTHRVGVTIRQNRTGAGTSYTGGSVWFYGIVLRQQPSAEGASEQFSVSLADPWWHLENLVYCQRFNVFAGWSGTPGDTPTFTEDKTSHLTLNQSFAGAVIGTREVLEDVIDWASDNSAPLQFVAGTFPDMKIPLREEKDITCAEAIRRQVDYMDAVSWFDYTTTPPTLKIARRSALTAVSRSIVGLKGISLTPRYDLQVPFVHLKFEKLYSDSGSQFLQISNQYAPDPLPVERFGGLLATIVLSPRQTNTVRQYVECGGLDASDLAFWRDVKRELNDEDLYADLTIQSYTVKAAETANGWTAGETVNLPRYLYKGAVADWMDVDAVRVDVTAVISYTVKETLPSNDKITLFKSRLHTIKASLLATDATTGEYSNTTVESAGEDPTVFVGLATNIYNDLNTLSWDGQVQLVEEECTGAIRLGNVLNLTAGNAAWASMNATVQAVSEDLDAGTTSVSLGVNKHLSAGQLVDLLRINRTRSAFRMTTNPSNGRGSDSSTLPGNNAEANTTEAAKLYNEHTVSGRDGAGKTAQAKVEALDGSSLPVVTLQRLGTTGAVDTSAGKILLELSRAFGKEIKIREAHGPDSGKYLLFLTSTTSDTQIIEGETPIELGGGGGGGTRMVIKEILQNTYRCRTWDGTTEGGTDITVARNVKLRGASSEVLDGITFTYSAYNTPAYTSRTASWTEDGDSLTEIQTIVPRVAVDDQIYAEQPTGGTGVTGASYIDTNRDARAWVAEPTSLP